MYAYGCFQEDKGRVDIWALPFLFISFGNHWLQDDLGTADLLGLAGGPVETPLFEDSIAMNVAFLNLPKTS